jgi:hypothetical protein
LDPIFSPTFHLTSDSNPYYATSCIFRQFKDGGNHSHVDCFIQPSVEPIIIASRLNNTDS